MQFRWIEWNIAKVESHGVRPEEAEYVVEHAKTPYPMESPDDKWLVRGKTEYGRSIQVVYLYDVDGADSAFVIHARPLSNREKRQLTRSRRRRGGR